VRRVWFTAQALHRSTGTAKMGFSAKSFNIPDSSFRRIQFLRVMETAALLPLLEQLDDNVDELEEVFAPILRSTVVETSKKLPVLDKAKFHVMITYALESLIFCTFMIWYRQQQN
jgi:hypothetical protein